MPQTIGVAERLEKNSEPDLNTGCRLWSRYLAASGYPRIKIGGHYGRPKLAHRVAYELNNGPIPEGVMVLHRCDTPSCVNPNHLFLGTHEDNMNDMHAKGRHNSGGGGAPKIAGLEEEILRLSDSGTALGVLASRFGVSKNAIRHRLRKARNAIA